MAEDLDLEKVLGIRLIREHTKTTDVQQVSDEQLKLYRRASIEACELEIGWKLSGATMYTQPVDFEADMLRGRSKSKVRLDYPAADGVVMVSHTSSDVPAQLNVKQNSDIVFVPLQDRPFDMGSCCSPCGSQAIGESTLSYNIGFLCVEDIPAGIWVGCLKYIAWSVMNPGDQLKTIKDGSTAEIQGLTGTNNAVWGSGAGEEWRRYRRRR